MNRHLQTALSLAVLCLPLVAQKIGEVPEAPPGPKAPRATTVEGVSAEGKPFWYRLPEKIDEKRPPALVIMLHGTGGNRGWAFWNYGVQDGRFRPNDIVVSPTGMTPGGGDSFNFVQGKADGDQIAGIIRQFRRALPVGKVYLYGHSQGAFFCYWFGGEHPDLIDGYIAHAGNVLQVKHPKLAKEKLAIAILHGKADAVVSVECAHRTHAIYEKEGYRKLKLEIVEGLNARSGHWPLPKQVTELMEWLDRVCADTPVAARDAIEHQLAAKEPYWAAIAASQRLLGTLLKKHRGEDREELLAYHAEMETRLDTLATETAAAILALPEDRDAEAAARVARFHPAFADRRAWTKPLRARITKLKREEKAVAKQLAALGKKRNRKTLLAAAKVLARSPHAPNLGDLAREITRRLESKPKGLKEAEATAIRADLEAVARTRAAAR